jgi:hypothetical protein
LLLTILTLALLVAVLASSHATTAAQSSGIYDLMWNTVDGSGSTSPTAFVTHSNL